MKLVDTHCHLEEIPDTEAAVERARAAGLIALVAVGSDFESNRTALALARRFPGMIYPALGIHPSMIAAAQTRDFEHLRENLGGAVALGEVGLDYHKRVLAETGKDRQKEVLRELLGLARHHGKPALMHSRYAWRDAFELVREAGLEKAVFHWFTGPTSVLRDIVEAGYYISATPAAEYHQEHRRAIKAAPPERLLLETDAPVRYGGGNETEPADLLRSLRAAAETRGMAEGELARVTTENAIRFFGLPGGGEGIRGS